MKKILALFFAVGAMTAVFAQDGRSRNESRDVILGQGNGNSNNRTVYDDHRNDGYSRNDGYNRNNGNYNERNLNDQIDRINRQYDWKIESVKRDRYLKNKEKKREIRDLESERDARIREIKDRFYDRNNNRSNTRRY